MRLGLYRLDFWLMDMGMHKPSFQMDVLPEILSILILIFLQGLLESLLLQTLSIELEMASTKMRNSPWEYLILSIFLIDPSLESDIHSLNSYLGLRDPTYMSGRRCM